MVKLTPQQVGKSGELLVQYWLLKNGIESAPLTTDYGIDLIAYVPATQKPVSIQVKTSSDRGKSSDKYLGWTISDSCPADYIAAVDLDGNRFWLFSTEEFKKLSHQARKGYRRLWWSLPGFEYKGAWKTKEALYKEYDADVVIRRILAEQA